MERYLKALTLVFFLIGFFETTSGCIVFIHFKTTLLIGTWLAEFITKNNILEADALRKLIVYLPMFIASIGLYFRQRWGRVIALAWSVLNFANFPVGTVFGIFGLWVLLKKETKQIFNIDESSVI